MGLEEERWLKHVAPGKCSRCKRLAHEVLCNVSGRRPNVHPFKSTVSMLCNCPHIWALLGDVQLLLLYRNSERALLLPKRSHEKARST